MRAEQKTDVKNSVGRMAFVILSVLIQAGWILLIVLRLNRYSAHRTDLHHRCHGGGAADLCFQGKFRL